MNKFEEEFNYLIKLFGKVLIRQIEVEEFEKHREIFLKKYSEKQQPEIPESVAKDIEEFRKHIETVGLLYYEDFMSHETLDWIIDIRNQAAFMQALSTGKYTVAKEKRFYLKDNRQLFNLENRDIVYSDLYLDDEGALITDKKYAKKFTQQEIDSMETGSYELIPVEEDV